MTLEQTKIEIKEIYKQRNELFNKRRYYQEKLKNYKDLQDRSECPCCEQKTNREYFKNKIPKTEAKLQEILNRIEDIIPKIKELETPFRIEIEKKNEEYRILINNYILQNKNRMNKCIRDYNKGLENYLPNILESERELWNDAIEKHLDKKGLDNNEELCFNIGE